jgi:hypothetical protein
MPAHGRMYGSLSSCIVEVAPPPMAEAICEANMVACEQGYLCDVCGRDVEAITESDLYLRYVLGEVSLPEVLAKWRRVSEPEA